MSKEVDTVLVLTTGKQDRGTRATLAFSWGCAALAMGQSASIFLTMDGTAWSMKGAMANVTVAGFDPLETYYEQFIELGGEILVCGPCAEYYCSMPKTGNAIPQGEAKMVGLATVVSKIGSTTKVITL